MGRIIGSACAVWMTLLASAAPFEHALELRGQTPSPATPAPPPSTPAASDPAKPTAAPPQNLVRISDLPPNQRLGARSAIVGQRIPTLSTVVIVPDAPSYIAAIGQWSLAARFPVLLDDGTWEAREGIARFVRAFKPAHVLRWRSEPANDTTWPIDPTARRAIVERAVASAWREKPDSPAPQSASARWRELQFAPPGVIAASLRDTAWTAALALAAARGQIIAWTDSSEAGNWPENQPDGWMLPDQADAITNRLFKACDQAGWESRRLGDDIDAVTLCLNCPVKVFLGAADQRNMLALTDVIGRNPGACAPGATREQAARWAWCGQILGSESRAACDAMSALFLTPTTAWLFDGYDDSAPWNEYDSTAAAVALEKLGVKTLVDDMGGSGSGRWRWRVAGQIDKAGLGRNSDDPLTTLDPDAENPPTPRRGLDADVICVNTSGNADFFDLKPGQCRAADVPILAHPSLLYFVHSWSATAPASRATVGGRWREHGAFAYIGSVNEPFLQGFVPTPIAIARLGVGLPLGAAVRHDDGPPWKITVLGDPLFMIARRNANIAAQPALTGAVDVAEQLSAQLKERDFAGAFESLRTLGRDRDSARLLEALIGEHPEAVTPDIALAGLSAPFFAGNLESFLRLYAVALPRIETSADLVGARDLLWHAFGPLAGTFTPAKVDLLSRSLRPDNLARDVGDLAPVAKRVGGDAAVQSLLSRARKLTSDPSVISEIERAVR